MSLAANLYVFTLQFVYFINSYFGIFVHKKGTLIMSKLVILHTGYLVLHIYLLVILTVICKIQCVVERFGVGDVKIF